ncbi:MAG: ABC transporter permease [Tannerella sp.]|jgi:ABC-type antimicrobial peptide transport system permease subunit|nr:ABC transporter permease [Tannerella sp.]
MKYLKIALRSLVHFKMYTIINVLGLAMSLTCVVIISRYVYNELTVDRFNKKIDRIYVSTGESSNRPGALVFTGIWNPNKEKSFKDLTEHPGVEKHAVFIKSPDSEISFNNRLYNTDILIVDSSFLQILDYPVISGAANIVRPEDAFISEAFARKIFGDINPVGEKLRYPSINKEMTVVGVIGKPATKSVISFDLLISSELMQRWSYMPNSLILLHPGVKYEDINRQYGEFMEMEAWNYSVRYQLFPYRDVYFEKDIVSYTFEHSNFMYVLILSVVGGLLLLTGLVNYINIYTVVILRRNKEFGIKKVFGAAGFKIFAQLLLENLSLIALSLIFALQLADLLGPLIGRVFEFEQVSNHIFDLTLAVVLALLLPLITSMMPVLRYRYASPVKSLQAVTMGSKFTLFRKFFLFFQYFITFVMIVVSLFFVRQLHFMLHQDLGYRTQNIIKVPFLKDDYGSYQSLSPEEFSAQREKINRTADELKQKMDASTLFEHWTQGQSPNERASSTYEFKTEGGELQKTTLISADESWFKVFEIKLLGGRLWENGRDDMYNYVMIVGESTLKQYGITDYTEAELVPFRRLWYSSEGDMSTNPPYRIVGVIRDFYTAHLSQKQDPVTVYFSKSRASDPVIASFRPGRRREVIEFMKNLHEELVGGEFTYTFLEDEIAAVYKEDRKVALIYSVFTGVAILISILGLFGLSLFDIQQRRKEIAIRKVNGAQTVDIIRLLLKKYFVMLGIAFAASIPVALFAISKYLENFAFKATVSWWLFGIAFVVTVAVSLLTLIYQIHKASNENPANVVKS